MLALLSRQSPKLFGSSPPVSSAATINKEVPICPPQTAVGTALTIDNPTELVAQAIGPTDTTRPPVGPQFPTDQFMELIAELEALFDPVVIGWRVTNITKLGKLREQVIPYAGPRAYTDRLNSLSTPAPVGHGKYAVHTTANFERVPTRRQSLRFS